MVQGMSREAVEDRALACGRWSRAAPFIFHTWKMKPTSTTFIPLTVEEKERISALVEKPDCGERVPTFVSRLVCERDQEALRSGGYTNSYFSLPKYLAI